MEWVNRSIDQSHTYLAVQAELVRGQRRLRRRGAAGARPPVGQGAGAAVPASCRLLWLLLLLCHLALLGCRARLGRGGLPPLLLLRLRADEEGQAASQRLLLGQARHEEPVQMPAGCPRMGELNSLVSQALEEIWVEWGYPPPISALEMIRAG